MTNLTGYVFQTKWKILNLIVFNMITWINESKMLTECISCQCKFKFHDRKCNSNQKCNWDKCWCECKDLKEHRVCIKDYNSNLLHAIVKTEVLLRILWLCDEITNNADSASTNVPTNVMCTVSTNVACTGPLSFENEKVRYNTDYYIL